MGMGKRLQVWVNASTIWVVDSYWRTISTTHMGMPSMLVGRGV
jgi:hypothetical protein